MAGIGCFDEQIENAPQLIFDPFGQCPAVIAWEAPFSVQAVVREIQSYALGILTLQ